MLKTLINLTLTTVVALSSAQAFSSDENSQEDKRQRKGPPPFSELDLDKDGLITLEEFQQHEIPRGDHETVFSHIDADRDSVITEDELSSHKPPRHKRD